MHSLHVLAGLEPPFLPLPSMGPHSPPLPQEGGHMGPGFPLSQAISCQAQLQG